MGASTTAGVSAHVVLTMAGLAGSATFPYGESTRLVSVTLSTVLVLRTVMGNVNTPPGSGRVVGVASLVTLSVGATSVSVTSAWAVGMTTLPSLSRTTRVTVSVYGEPTAVPLTGPVKVHA